MLIDSIIQRQPIEKGWSGDKKYCVTVSDGTKYLLRVSPAEKYERRKCEFEKMKEVYFLGIPMAKPIEFGICDEGVYTVESFIDGDDAEPVICGLTPEKQYSYGIDAKKCSQKIENAKEKNHGKSDKLQTIIIHFIFSADILQFTLGCVCAATHRGR